MLNYVSFPPPTPPSTDLCPPAMDLREGVRLLRRRGPLIGSVTAACGLFALLVALALTPLYRGEAVVLLEPRRTDVMDIDSVVSSLTAGSEAVRSEMDIIRSRAVIDRVIEKANLLDDREFNTSSRLWNALNPAHWLMRDLSEEERRAAERTRTAENLSRRLKVANDGRSYSIHIAFDSKKPAKAALIANAFADAYLLDQLEAKYEATARANKWLNDRLGELKGQVETSEKAVQAYREKANLIQVADGQTVAAKQMEDINKQLSEARGATSQAEARLQTARALLDSKNGVESAADVLASPLIQNLREQEAEVRRNEAQLAAKYGPLHPKMVNAQAQYRDLQAKIAEEVRKVVQGLANQVDIAKAKESALGEQLRQLESRAAQEMKADVELRQLQREAGANRSLYESFLNRYKQTAEQKDMPAPDSRIIARAETPIKPVFPSKGLFLLVGLLFGGALGVVAAYLVEYFDSGFRSAAQVEEKTGLAVIGMIPDTREATGQSPEDYVISKPLSSYNEALRTVRTAIHYANVDEPPRIIMVTSATPNEGKTTFCLSFGRMLAAAGASVLLIDADLRHSPMTMALGLAETGGGLAATLSGQRTLADVVQEDPLVANLHVMAAHGRIPNAQELLGSRRMQKVLREAAQHYDFVIVDTPPVLAVSDAAIVAQVVDTTIFVVRWAGAAQEAVGQAVKQLRSFNCPIAGAVMTQVNVRECAKYGDGYSNNDYSAYYAD